MLKMHKLLLLCVVFTVLLLGYLEAGRQMFGRRCSLTTEHVCISNLKQLEGAKTTWAVEYKYGKHTNDVPTWSEIIGEGNYIATKPECPEGGIYILGAAGEPPRCTVAGHVLP
jgi:hypothetical protein